MTKETRFNEEFTAAVVCDGVISAVDRDEESSKRLGSDVLGGTGNPMHVTRPILVVLFFAVAAACIMKANLIFYQILDEVNSKRPRERQFSFIFVNLRAFEIMGEHAQLFQDSRKRKLMYVWGGIGFTLGLVPFCFWIT